MSSAFDPGILAQIFAFIDHRSDPMVGLLEVRFLSLFDDLNVTQKQWKNATEALFKKHPGLLRSFEIRPEAWIAHVWQKQSPEDLSKAVDKAWSENHLDLDSFRVCMIPLDSPPLIRFRYRKGEGLCLGVHHCLMDGRSVSFLLYELLACLCVQLGLPSPPETSIGTLKRGIVQSGQSRWFGRLRLLIFSILRNWEVWSHQTALLQPPRPQPNQTQCFREKVMEWTFLEEIRKKAELSGNTKKHELTVIGLLVASFHIALAQFFEESRKSADRISINVPVDLRSWFPEPEPFCNWVGYISVSSLVRHRSDRWKLLAHVHKQMDHSRRFRTETIIIRILGAYERWGVLRMARKIFLETGLPRRFVKKVPAFWKNLDTAILTHAGRARVPIAARPWVTRVVGYATIISPGVSIALARFGSQISWGLRYGSETLTEDESERLMVLFTEALESYSR